MKRLFGTDGIRGIVNDELTVELALKLGNSIARLYNGKYKKLLIGMDTRNSGEMLQTAISAGAISAGMDVECCGVIPTPGLSFLTREEKTIGVMISASHNPSIYNGLKVIAEGYKLSDEEEVDLENLILNKEIEYSPYGGIGKVKVDSLRRRYIDYVVSNYRGIKSDYKVVVDVGNGAAGVVVSEILEELGLNWDVEFNSPDGFNINDKCGSTSPENISNIVKHGKYDFGVLFDGDADRCLFVDSNGKIVDGDKLMALNAIKMKEQQRLKNNFVVATIMSNLGLEKYLKENGIELLRTQVGDKYVLLKMLEIDGNLGGEQSGHIIFKDKSTTGDGIITSLETLETMNHFGKNINELIKQIKDYPQRLINVSVKDKKKIMTDTRILNKIEEYEKKDGVRLIMRASGTEHKIRIMTEGVKESIVNEVAEELSAMVDSIDKE